ncbi:unnamed protein product [Albugo candida]|uniref:Uncharacterized protein n=1 Tax=Albugo candida TaxID=65357 RepID=A0A024GDL9_9STRA|nr:unnamed protein product [Albugo candida]|eukprot:CCI44404.1 unnamed protein product [Albugo candida]
MANVDISLLIYERIEISGIAWLSKGSCCKRDGKIISPLGGNSLTHQNTRMDAVFPILRLIFMKHSIVQVPHVSAPGIWILTWSIPDQQPNFDLRSILTF